jgi:hypothetical protein
MTGGPSSAPGSPQDPVRANLVAILRHLNQAVATHEGSPQEQVLELPEIERRLSDFWAVEQGSIKVSLAVGLLLRNGLVSVADAGAYSWQRQRSARHSYMITPEGKKFLVDAIETSDRIS